jgi:hypothetical protein
MAQLDAGQVRIKVAKGGKGEFNTCLAQVSPKIIRIAEGEGSTLRHPLPPCWGLLIRTAFGARRARRPLSRRQNGVTCLGRLCRNDR